MAWSALSTPLSWAASIATQAGANQLVDTPGPITGIRTLGEAAVVFKARSCYLMVYQGPPSLWTFRVIASDVGAASHEAVIDTNTALLFMGYDDLWAMGLDYQPVSIANGIREWFFADLDRSNIAKVQGPYDRDRNLCYWFYAQSGASGALTKYLCYSLDRKAWGAGSLAVQCAGETLSTGTSYNAFVNRWPMDFSRRRY